MPYEISSSKITGKPDQHGWAQVYDYLPFDQKTLDEKGRLFSLISVSYSASDESHPSGIGNVILAREVLNKIHEEYYSSNLSGSNHHSGPLPLINKITRDITEQFSGGQVFQIGLIAIIKNTIYLACGGGVKIFIQRQSVYTPLITSEKNFFQSASGNVRAGDAFLVGTDSFFSNLPEETIKSALSANSPESFVEGITSQPNFPEDVASLAVLFVQTKDKEVDLGPKLESNLVKAKDVSDYGRVDFSDNLQKNDPLIPQPDISLNFKNASGLFRKIFEKKLYIQGTELSDEAVKRQRMAASVGLVLLVVLSVSIFFGIRQKKENDIKNKYANEIETATHELEESENLLTLNPERSRELFLQGRERVLGIASTLNSQEITDLKGIIDKNQGKILGEYKSSLETFVDLDLLTKGFEGQQLSISGDNLNVLDSKSKKIVKVNVQTKRAEVIAGPTKIDEADAFASYSDWVYVANSKGIFEVSKDLKKVSDEIWPNSLMYAFASNLYILDKGNSEIFRLVSAGDVFGKSSKWTIDEHNVNLSSAISLAIDGFVWVLDERGQVNKFARGNPQNFKLSVAGISGFQPVYIFAREDVNDLYFLDKKNGKVVVFDKDGKFKAQYINDEIKNTIQFAVSEKDKKMILLNGSKLFSMELKHLN